MREFLQGWRCKTGLVTLAMALLLAAEWGRSHVVVDDITCVAQQAFQQFYSAHGRICWKRVSPYPYDLPAEWKTHDATKRGTGSVTDGWDMTKVDWYWECAGIEFVRGTNKASYARGHPKSRAEEWIIPYWSLVLPLTLLSAWLILFKPRPAMSVKESKQVLDQKHFEGTQ